MDIGVRVAQKTLLVTLRKYSLLYVHGHCGGSDRALLRSEGQMVFF